MENSSVRPPIGEKAVERQDRALAVVQRLLRERGIRSRCHHTISLGLSAVRDGEATCADGASPLVAPAAGPSFWLKRLSPELVVTGPGGRSEATVTIEERSGAYLLSLHDRPGLQTVGPSEPEKVADLIAGALGAAR